MNHNILISKESSGQRLDIIISQTLGLSRSQAQRLIKANNVAVNGQVTLKSNYQVNNNDKNLHLTQKSLLMVIKKYLKGLT